MVMGRYVKVEGRYEFWCPRTPCDFEDTARTLAEGMDIMRQHDEKVHPNEPREAD